MQGTSQNVSTVASNLHSTSDQLAAGLIRRLGGHKSALTQLGLTRVTLLVLRTAELRQHDL